MEVIKSQVSIRAIHGLLWGLAAAAFLQICWSAGQAPFTWKPWAGSFSGVDLSVSFRVDFISTTLLAMVTLLGAVIGHYSLRYLAGEPRQRSFYFNLLFTVGSTCLLVMAGNLILLWLAWLSSSFGLHRLLTYFQDRPRAVIAARKKFIVSRIGDLSLFLAILLTYKTFHSFEFDDLFAQATNRAHDAASASLLTWIGFLFALGAMTKSAQFPFHFWLTETMETPTPVSALMHAGIINAGGFLIIRLSPILQSADAAHVFLATVGSFTAVFGGLVMITQNDIKKKLAYSTISQMGMMLFACGLGAYSLALFHMIAHSFYKAHSFLSTGFLVEESKKLALKAPQPTRTTLFLATTLGFIVVLAGVIFFNGVYFAYFTYGAVLLLGLLQSSLMQGVRIRLLGTLAVAMGAFVIIEHAIHSRLVSLVPVTWEAASWSGTGFTGAPQILMSFVCYFIFASGFWLSNRLSTPNTAFLKRLYFYLWNGGYLSTTSSRVMGAVSSHGRRIQLPVELPPQRARESHSFNRSF